MGTLVLTDLILAIRKESFPGVPVPLHLMHSFFSFLRAYLSSLLLRI